MRPELGALGGAVLVWLFFAAVAGAPFAGAAGTAAWLNAAAPLGLLALAVALLMVGGEFDLSVGSILGAASMTVALLAGHFGLAIGPAVLAALALGLLVGLANGLLVVRTGLPSFIVTLGTLFVLRGLAIGATRLLTGRTQVGGLARADGYEGARLLLAGTPFGGVRAAVLWWLALALLAAFLLRRTRAGNWIFAAGGAPDAARAMGVPVARVKVALFLGTGLAAAFVGAIQAVQFAGADVLRGEGQEFRAIVAAVIGGTLLTGGYGSVVGSVFGAAVFGMVQQGIVITGVDADWFLVFLGAMLLAAALFNEALRRRALAAGRPAEDDA